ncbi:MAG TPA: damage-inducible protein DinB [Flavobacteriaceae bacterium]|nr:damage-inducible protein DinB [Flavobacteriaceae bacterium]HAT67606.1 damage-inducible protein DinB [Flavobacteriaceae bacterium]|tara:strand:- start:147385 stop:147897 length:513 start_codon:yes stop_codon:yes gene_type:complete
MYSEITSSEYAPFYEGYINKSKGIEIVNGLEMGLYKTEAFFESIPIQKLEYRYAEGKWTPKEILLHLIDSERVFAYRALFISRATTVEIQGFDQDEFVKNSNANSRDIIGLLEEYITVRKSSISLFSSFSNETMTKMGKANDSNVSIRAIGRIILGHEIHHTTILKERYL